MKDYRFILLGQQAVNTFMNEGIDALVEQDIEKTVVALQNPVDPLAVLSEYDGWHNYANLDAEEFVKLGGELPIDFREEVLIVPKACGSEYGTEEVSFFKLKLSAAEIEEIRRHAHYVATNKNIDKVVMDFHGELLDEDKDPSDFRSSGITLNIFSTTFNAVTVNKHDYRTHAESESIGVESLTFHQEE